ncbi:hypothetical protein PP304_gp151 [Gordonia phage Phendrix]|uniref:Uncharacterized protein n=1 Tax=Gordonia phage Phendrix TaxID=2593335 RepID=A0A514U193_9CAUD|nr:hypothetical protein PP304_gp151 [Gordonia phage Phendrix]QDK02718.1 hypothetical protein SEA_PHENDRIX_202 [Gordonia phage Phendrix]
MIQLMPEPRVFRSTSELTADVTAVLTEHSYKYGDFLPAYRLPNGKWLYAKNRDQALRCYDMLGHDSEKRSFGWNAFIDVEKTGVWKEWLGE